MCREWLCDLSKRLGTVCPETIHTESVIYIDDTPVIEPRGRIHINEASSICLDVIEQYGNRAELYLPDMFNKVYSYDEVVECAHLEYVSTLPFIAELHDCDDFAAHLFGKWAGLAWTNNHALNFFISEANEFYFIEPQTRKISKTLDTWQGKSLRFLLGR